MPYTPPSHLSPASSASASPHVSRGSSLPPGPLPSLPRSASYLNKHRRTPCIAAVHDAPSISLPAHDAEPLGSPTAALGDGLRQSLPLSLDGRDATPKGAILSPPESASSESDDDEPPEARGRELIALKDLRDAVSQIPQPRTPSPPSLGSDQPRPIRVSFSTGALSTLPLTGCSVGHAQSPAETRVAGAQSADNSLSVSDEDSDEDLKIKPQMVRKKSGELVRPALHASHRRPSSMPGTPVFSKAVHFDSHLEHVRHFLQIDRPLAVSAGSSPVDAHESDGEYPFPTLSTPDPRSPPVHWELVTANFPHDSHLRKAMAVRLEKVWLSADQRSMLGSVAVANLAFQKHVTCRFTLDDWKTVSEVSAQYSHEIRPCDVPPGYDRFTFAIKLSDLANLESKTLFLCIRYSVLGEEFWDNNKSTNFQVGFKKHLSRKGARNGLPGDVTRSPNGLPRSNRRPNGASSLRPVSMPVPLDAFGSGPDKFHLHQPIHKFLGESEPTSLRLKTKSSANLAADSTSQSLAPPSGAAFSNRYDFGASLTAAMQAAKDSAGQDKDALYMKRNVRAFEPMLGVLATESPTNSAGHSPVGTLSPNASLPSASYEELVNRYCFFGSKQTSPPTKDGTPKSGRVDRFMDGNGVRSGIGSAQQNGPRSGHEANTAVHHSIRLHDSSPHYPSLAIAGSPVASAAQSLAGSSGHDYFSAPTSVGLARSTPPALASGAGTPSSDGPYHSQQQALPERFPWNTETQAATAIRG